MIQPRSRSALRTLVMFSLLVAGLLAVAGCGQPAAPNDASAPNAARLADANLENDDLGTDPSIRTKTYWNRVEANNSGDRELSLPSNYSVDRLEEATLPGPVNPNDAIGLMPAPPGFASGQGGRVAGFAGGLGGRAGAIREQMLREGGGHLPLYRRVLGPMKDEAVQPALNADPQAPNAARPAEHSTEQYEKFIPNPFLTARDNPLSTFSIDVDTASYALVRRFLKDEGRLPPPDAVRIEELVNYFDYSYPQPKGDHPVSITPEVSACPWNSEHRLVRIAVQARDVDPQNLPPRNLVFLIDVSGSMADSNKLPLVKESLHLLIDQLGEKDKVSIVVYAGQAGTVLESTPGNEKETIRAAVNRLGAGGSTNGAGGILAAYEEAHKNFIPGGVNRVILATDGDFNVGVTSQGELVRLIEEKRGKGIFLTALGYGMGNLKDNTIMKLANHGHGHYAYIDSLAEARKVFVEEGMSLIALAKDVKVQVEFNPKTVASYKLIGYEKRLMRAQDFNDDTKLAAVMGCGHRVTALYEIVPANLPPRGEGGGRGEGAVPPVNDLKYQKPAELTKDAESNDILTVKVRYKEPLGEQSQLLSASVQDGKEAFDKASEDFRFAAAVAAFAILLRDNPKDAGINLKGVAELAESAKGKDARGHRREFVELAKKADQLK